MKHVSSDVSAGSSGFSAPPRLMSPATMAVLSDALDAHRETALLDSRLRPAARLVCEDARASELKVEQLLVALKSEWSVLLEQRHVPAAARPDLTSRFITLCIYEYYASRPTPRRVGTVAAVSEERRPSA